MVLVYHYFNIVYSYPMGIPNIVGRSSGGARPYVRETIVLTSTVALALMTLKNVRNCWAPKTTVVYLGSADLRTFRNSGA